MAEGTNTPFHRAKDNFLSAVREYAVAQEVQIRKLYSTNIRATPAIIREWDSKVRAAEKKYEEAKNEVIMHYQAIFPNDAKRLEEIMNSAITNLKKSMEIKDDLLKHEAKYGKSSHDQSQQQLQRDELGAEQRYKEDMKVICETEIFITKNAVRQLYADVKPVAGGWIDPNQMNSADYREKIRAGPNYVVEYGYTSKYSLSDEINKLNEDDFNKVWAEVAENWNNQQWVNKRK